MLTDKKIKSYQEIVRISARLKKQNKKIVFVTGCFDIMHFGHIIFLNYAKKQGDVLVIGLGSDKTIKKLKGPIRPILNEKLRSRMLAAIEIVDYVIISKEKLINYNIDFSVLIAKIKPDVFVVPITDKKLDYKKSLVGKYNGKLKTCRRLPPEHLRGGISSSKILEEICKKSID
ncbi:MAG: adenylyltransferase/cytidyltransferase family protein [bacterium]